MTPLDLEDGDDNLANATPAERRAAARKRAAEAKPASDKPPRKGSKARDEAEQAELRSRLDRVFDRIALSLESREDYELATVIREDTQAMTQGINSLTRGVTVLRGPIIMALNLIEPVLAFGRVGRILLGRFAERQRQRQAAAETEQFQDAPTQPMS